MAKVFFPIDYVMIEASKPHPENTQYKVSFGHEDWDGKHVPIFKVQMVYDGKVSGRRSPSYPLNSDDYERVHNAVQELMTKHTSVFSGGK